MRLPTHPEFGTIFLDKEKLLAVIPQDHLLANKELDVPAYRNIGLALRNKKNISLAVKHFLDYLQYRQ